MTPQQIEQTNLETRRFFSALYSRYFENHDGYCEIRVLRKSPETSESIFFKPEDLGDEDLAGIREINSDSEIIFSVNPLPLSKAKKQDDIKDIVCLWTDIDGKDFKSGKKDEALRRLQGFPIAPSIIVDSGHGYHGYWVLTEPIINLAGDQRILFKQILSGVVKEIGGDTSKVNFNACLRVPGTLNIKNNPPVECHVLSLTEWTYQLEDFARFKDAAYVEPEAFSGNLSALGTRTSIISNKGEIFARGDVARLEIPASNKNLIITGDLRKEDGVDQTHSGRDFHIIKSLIRQDYDYLTIRSIFLNPFLGCSDRIRKQGEPRLQNDVKNALKKVQPQHPATAAGEQLIVRCAADIEPEQTSWLWPERFALGKLSLIVGDPESGKSLFCAWMGAQVTSGKAWPDGATQSQGKVIILQCEDDPAETVVPRLEQYGADRNQVFIVDGVKTPEGGDRMVSLLTDLGKIEDLIRSEQDVRLVIIDPLQAYLGAGISGKVNPHADAHIRAILTPVKVLAEKYGVAIVGVVHLNKDDQKDMMYRVGGSIALVGLPRAIWLLKWDRDPNGFRYFQSMKSNRRAGVSGLAFKIDRDLGDVSFHDVPVPTATELLTKTNDRGPREEAKALIMEQLKDGPQELRKILAEAAENGINRTTLFAAKKALGIKSERISFGGRGGRCIWQLPAQSEEDETVAE